MGPVLWFITLVSGATGTAAAGDYFIYEGEGAKKTAEWFREQREKEPNGIIAKTLNEMEASPKRGKKLLDAALKAYDEGGEEGLEKFKHSALAGFEAAASVDAAEIAAQNAAAEAPAKPEETSLSSKLNQSAGNDEEFGWDNILKVAVPILLGIAVWKLSGSAKWGGMAATALGGAALSGVGDSLFEGNTLSGFFNEKSEGSGVVDKVLSWVPDSMNPLLSPAPAPVM